MAYTDIYTAATDDTHVLRKQCAVACYKAALDVINEDPETANHGNRLAWARKITQDANAPTQAAARWVWALFADATIRDNPTTASDATVQNAVNGILNTMANRG